MSLTVDEFEQLVPPFEAAFVRHTRNWTMEDKPRTGRRYSQYTNCPLTTPEDRPVAPRCYLRPLSRHRQQSLCLLPTPNYVSEPPSRFQRYGHRRISFCCESCLVELKRLASYRYI
jgi:hypothetical protein